MKLAALVIALALSGNVFAQDRFQMEYDAYIKFLGSEFNAGRLTKEQALYMAEEKRNSLTNQRQNELNAERASRNAHYQNLLNNAAGLLQSQQPRYLSPQMNCSTYNVNGITHTNCR